MKKHCGRLFKALYSEEFEVLMNDLTAYATESLCRENNIPYYVIDEETITHTMDFIPDARDLSHFGKSTHRELANKFLDIIK